MEHFYYERPREKLRNHGVSTLTIAELFQLILGSGTAQATSAQLAQGVESLLLEDAITFDALIQLRGMGEAKACQIIGVLEVAKRLYSYE